MSVVFDRWLRRDAAGVGAQPGAVDVEGVLVARCRWWPLLDADEHRRVVALTASLLHRFGWEAARGFELSEEIRVMIAAQGALMLLGLDDDGALDNVGTVIVHRSMVTTRGEHAVGGGVVSSDPMALAGQAQHRGPLVISWRGAQRDLRRLGTGHNVVVHELAHKLDMLDGLLDGTPPLDGDAARTRWVAVCEAELARVQHGDFGPLRAYAATNPAEFFAVASEVFFDRPVALACERPELYGVLGDFYGQDPARRVISYESAPRSADAAVASDTGR